MDFFDVATTQRAIRRLKPEPIPDAVLRQIMNAAICAPQTTCARGRRHRCPWSDRLLCHRLMGRPESESRK